MTGHGFRGGASTGLSTTATAVGMTLLAAATTWVTLTSWQGFVAEPSTFLSRLGAVAVVVALLGVLLRSTRLPRLVVVAVQAAAVTALVSHQITGSPVPVGAAASELMSALDTAIESARIYPAPVAADAPAVWPLLVVSGAALILIVDTVACTFRQVPGAGLALLAIYSVPSGLLDLGGDWSGFVLATAGFLAMLRIDAQDHTVAWGRPVREGSPRRGLPGPARDAVRASTWMIGASSTVLALALPTLVPVLSLDLLDVGGSGGGDGNIRIEKPLVDMRRDLERGEPTTLLQFTTDDPAPSYLRVAVLNRFTGDEWSSGDRDVNPDATSSGPLPRPPGLSAEIPLTSYRYDIRATAAFDSTWLPTTFPAAAVYATGDWRYDPSTMDFLAASDDLDTRGMQYSVTSLEPNYGRDGRRFADPTTSAVSDEVLATPGVSDTVRELARSVTDPATSDYERATLLQRWFREDGGFTYDLSRAPNGNGNDTLDQFLSPAGRVGYCEQYAAAMAVMARTLGIPARVAVGFLRPTRYDDGTWEYTSHDLHAWPELYFDGVGWVRFEPTPADRAAVIPPYSRSTADRPGDAGPTAPTSSAAPSAAPSGSAAPSERPDTDQLDPTGAGEDGADGEGPVRWLVVLAVLLVVAGAAVALLGPPALRRQRRASGVRGTPEEVWTELRDTTRDLGGSWPDGRSPREVGTVVASQLASVTGDPTLARPATGPAAAPEAADALERIVHAVEQARYRHPEAGATGGLATRTRTDLTQDASAVIAALEAGVSARSRRRARWAPRSVWRR